uniref:hypothetical protein n=1 Tax=Catenulispora rubra TaxID=280293 RepID=UPI0018923CDB
MSYLLRSWQGCSSTFGQDDGLKGKIENFDNVTVWPSADPRSVPQSQLASLPYRTTQAPVMIICFTPGHTDTNGMGYGDTYKIKYDGGSGYTDAQTDVLIDKGALAAPDAQRTGTHRHLH